MCAGFIRTRKSLNRSSDGWDRTPSRNRFSTRQLIVLYNSYLPNQLDSALLKQIVDKAAEIANKFNTFRGTIDGKEVTDNDIVEILQKETDSSKREKAWEASKMVGKALLR